MSKYFPQKDLFLERISNATGVEKTLEAIITGVAEALDNLEKRIEKLEPEER